MSQYISFFIRCGDELYPLFSYSRNTKLYEVFKVAPYEHITAIKQVYLLEYLHDLDFDLKRTEEEKKRCEEKRQLISTFNNSVEEKIYALNGYEESISELENTIKEISHTSSIISLLDSIIDEVKYKTSNIDAENYLYCGIEVWEPKVEDIV